VNSPLVCCWLSVSLFGVFGLLSCFAWCLSLLSACSLCCRVFGKECSSLVFVNGLVQKYAQAEWKHGIVRDYDLHFGNTYIYHLDVDLKKLRIK